MGASTDAPDVNQEFAQNSGLHFPLLSDPGGDAVRALGIASDGGYAQRTTFLIDQEGTVRRIWTGVKIDGHADEVLEAARALGA